MEDSNKESAVVDLERDKAIAKMQELVRHNKLCLFGTRLNEPPIEVRPMSTQDVDNDGNFWFLSGHSSNKNFELNIDPHVQLFYSNTGDAEFLTVYGNAEEIRDKERINDLWSPIAKAWFKDGKNDPDLTVIKVTPDTAYYWDTKSSKMISLIKIMASTVSGTTMDDGVKGSLKV